MHAILYKFFKKAFAHFRSEIKNISLRMNQTVRIQDIFTKLRTCLTLIDYLSSIKYITILLAVKFEHEKENEFTCYSAAMDFS